MKEREIKRGGAKERENAKEREKVLITVEYKERERGRK